MTPLLLAVFLALGHWAADPATVPPEPSPQSQTPPKKPPPKPKPINPDETGGPRGAGVMLRGTVVDAAGKDLSEVKVVVAGDSGSKQRWETTTDANGRFQLADLPVGLFTLELSRPGYRTGRHAALKLDSLLCSVRVAMQTGEPQNVSTDRFVELRGRVRDAAGDPVPEAQVEIRGGTFARGVSLLTDSEGEFHLPNLQSGSYTVHATAPGYAPAEKPLTVSPDGALRPVSVTLELRKTG